MSESKNNVNFSPNSKEIEVKKMSDILLIILSIFSVLIQLPLLFIPAGRWDWIEAWIYLLMFYVFITCDMLLINKKNPQLLINRMKTKKSGITKAQGSDKWLLPLISINFIGIFLIPAFDVRYSWSRISIYVEIAGFVLLAVAFYFLFRSMLDNAYASKVLDIRKEGGQKVIDTGSYAIVRHPMYTGFMIMGFGVTLGLGSWFGLIPAVILTALLIARISYEERMLIEGLEGYEEYKKKVKYKLIPKVF